jgi:uncharacterized protein involved in exopolysaccharide biosynthesis
MMDKNTNSNELAELKAKLVVYEKWSQEQKEVQESEIDLRKLVYFIWRGKWKVILSTLLAATLSVYYALSLPNIYKAEALLAPNNQDGQKNGLGSLAGQFGGLASLAGINLGAGATDKTGYAIEVLKSRDFIFKFLDKNDLKAPILASSGWNRSTNTLVYDLDIYDPETMSWIRDVAPPRSIEPSMQEVYQVFRSENLFVTQDEESGFVKLAVYHYSPYLAKQLVDDLITALNTTIKKQDMAEAVKSIKYFEDELKNIDLAGAQAIFYQLIEQQQQKLMLTKVRDDYVLKVVDPAIVPELKSKPKRALICVLGTIAGFILSILSLSIFYFVRKD